MKQEGSNKIRQQYLVANRNYAFCSDITQLARNSHYIAYIIDLGSRLVIAHIITEQITNAGDLTLLLKQGLANRQLTGATIFHSDLGSQYTSSEFRDFAMKEGLQISTAARASHENQVAERFNRTLKGLIRRRLLAEPGSPSPKSSTSRLVLEVSFEHLAKVVNACVEEYNSEPHGGYSMYKASPFDMDEALSNSKSVLEAAKDDNSMEALSIRRFRADVVNKYAGNWESFFLDWRSETRRQAEKQAEASRVAAEASRAVAEVSRALYEQNRRLEEQNRQLQEKVEYLVHDVQQKQEEQEALMAVKLKRRLARKLPVRDSISREDLDKIMGLTTSKSYTGRRKRLAFLLLYYTGLRVSNLLVLKRFHLDEILREQETTIPLIKGGAQRHFVTVGAEGLRHIKEHHLELQTLLEGKEPDTYVFTPKPSMGAQDGAISRETLDRELNAILIKASAVIGKHLRTHSFRAAFITDLLNSGVPIQEAKDLVGHKDIKSTYTYYRSPMTAKRARSIISSVTRSRLQDYKRPINVKANKARGRTSTSQKRAGKKVLTSDKVTV